MYDNRCGVEAQVYPCRSYCVQLAKTCANNVVEWIELCRAIDCPPTDEECVPGPYTQVRPQRRTGLKGRGAHIRSQRLWL